MIMMLAEESTLDESPDDILLPRAAAAYIGRLWKRPFTSKDFTNLRSNYSKEIADLGVEPVSRSASITQWRRCDLAIIAEKIPPPEYSEYLRKPRKRRRPNSQSED